MADRLSDPIGRLMGLRYKSHPWHGIFIGKDAPENVVAFIEVVPTDTVKYEIDKESGFLKLDRPQELVGQFCMEKTSKTGIKGDGDPIDICVLTEKTIAHGDILVDARPIGGFRMIDGNEADDKIIAVLSNDVVYSEYNDLSDLPDIVVERLKHYFLTYKDMPGKVSNTEITHIYSVEEALEVIKCSMEDYHQRFDNIGKLL
jgi:inorganic pyrophosphatase